MKALSIGRDQECDIIINDATDVISRRHATLNISSSGKITIVPTYNSMTRYIVMGGVGIFIVACGIFAYQYMLDNPSTPEPKQDTVSVTDSLKVEKPGVVKDSINIKKEPSKQKEDSISAKPQKQKEKKGENKKEPTPSVPKDSTRNNRPIG